MDAVTGTQQHEFYAATTQVRTHRSERRHAAQVRDVFSGELERCQHKHTRVSEAMDCAEQMLATYQLRFDIRPADIATGEMQAEAAFNAWVAGQTASPTARENL